MGAERAFHRETQNDIDDDTIEGGCPSAVDYEVYVNINEKDGTVTSGYLRESRTCGLEKEDKTVIPSFSAGTQTEVRKTSPAEQERYGNSNVVIVSDVRLNTVITLGGI